MQEERNLDRKALYHIIESYDYCQVVNHSTHKYGATLDLVFAQAEDECLKSILKTL